MSNWKHLGPAREHQDSVVTAALALDKALSRDPADPLWSARIKVERDLLDKAIRAYYETHLSREEAQVEVRIPDEPLAVPQRYREEPQ